MIGPRLEMQGRAEQAAPELADPVDKQAGTLAP